MRRSQVILAVIFMCLFFVAGVSFLLLTTFSLNKSNLFIKYIILSFISFIGMTSLAKNNLKVWKRTVGKMFILVGFIFIILLIISVNRSQNIYILDARRYIINGLIILTTLIIGGYFVKTGQSIVRQPKYYKIM
ncbi:hypothetical protein [Clostridium sp. OS1-26]|uniref:hypothetical protein n=1 Tax=Clostridium sp. OS1-26 TaxID=3070681 RepID=UPI0027DFD147|nr:hypothetical protein [Clostridium sp. OS1-26]WML37050.1 hypothetical protein RCG18_10780 [Clostridium sp. OS1-26]